MITGEAMDAAVVRLGKPGWKELSGDFDLSILVSFPTANDELRYGIKVATAVVDYSSGYVNADPASRRQRTFTGCARWTEQGGRGVNAIGLLKRRGFF